MWQYISTYVYQEPIGHVGGFACQGHLAAGAPQIQAAVLLVRVPLRSA